MASHTAVDIGEIEKKEQPAPIFFLIERDYRTNVIRLMEYMPVELEKIVGKDDFELLITEINNCCAQACSPQYLESLLDFLSLFLYGYFSRNSFYKCITRLQNRIELLNQQFSSKGFRLCNPADCAFMHLEIDILPK